jgi:hypothetical protein
MFKFKIRNIFHIIIIIFILVLPYIGFAADVAIAPINPSVNVGSQITLTVNVNNVSNLFGAAFDLVFDPSILNFVSASKGAFLEQGGAETTLLTSVSPSNRLIVGYSRLASGGIATGISGSGALMTLVFNGVTAGASNLIFQNNALCNATSSLGCNVITANWQNSLVSVTGDTTPPAPPQNLRVN